MQTADPTAAADPPDHRALGRRLDLFTTDELVGSGLPMWLPDGAVVREQLEHFVVDLERRAGYRRVYSPVLGKRELYERSGHWTHFQDDMFPAMDVGGEQLVLRPSNCPHHCLIYGAEHRSVHDLPVRLSELGAMFRSERSGVLGGLSRVRAMTLNDAHVFVAPLQLDAEIAAILDLIAAAYEVLGIDDHWFRLSLPGPAGTYVDAPDLWAVGEASLRSALGAAGVRWEEAADEAAYYGPKIDVQVHDARGREQTLSTVQVDFHQPDAFDLTYQDAGGVRRRPVLIHRSLISTMERMTAFLIERHAGRFPVWLAPVQVAVLPVSDVHVDAAHDLVAHAATRGVRAAVADARHSLAARVRHAHERGVPFVGVIGDREVAAGTVSLRRRGGVQLPVMQHLEALDAIASLVARRSAGLDLS